MKRRLFALAIALLLAVSLPVSALAATWYLENGDITIRATEDGQYVSQGDNAAVEDNTPVIKQNEQNDSSTATDKTITIDPERRNGQRHIGRGEHCMTTGNTKDGGTAPRARRDADGEKQDPLRKVLRAAGLQKTAEPDDRTIMARWKLKVGVEGGAGNWRRCERTCPEHHITITDGETQRRRTVLLWQCRHRRRVTAAKRASGILIPAAKSRHRR